MKNTYKSEKELLYENEIRTNGLVSKVLFFAAIIVVPLIVLLQVTGVFIYYMNEAIYAIVMLFTLLILPRILLITSLKNHKLFKYFIVFCIIATLPSIYLEFDYMALIFWVFPLLISAMYFDNKLNVITVIADVAVLGVTSYIRSANRLAEGLISSRVGGLFKDFIISDITYSMLIILSFAMIYVLTKKNNYMLKEMVKNKRYEMMSITDSMTGVYNHRYLIDVVEINKKKYDTDKTPFSVILFDIDYFKIINDTYGHVEGDQVLVEVASALIHVIRDTDIIGRYGGEEFMVVLPNTTVEGAYHIAERCRESVKRLTFEKVSNVITISGGVVEYSGSSIKELIREVDLKMYQAKDAGRNRIIA